MKTPMTLLLLAPLAIGQVASFTVQPFAGMDPFGNGGTATNAYLSPSFLKNDGSGNVYVLDRKNQQLRKIATSGVITQVAGTGGAANFVPGKAMKPAQLSLLGASAMMVESADTLLIASGECQILRLDLRRDTVTLAAGGAPCNNYASGGGFPTVGGMARDQNGFTYFAAPYQHVILRLDPNSGQVRTYSGIAASAGFTDGALTQALFNGPSDIAVDSSNNLYVADTNNCRIRRINTSSGAVQTVVGVATSSPCGFNENGRPGQQTMINLPVQLAVDGSNALYFTESQDARVRKLDFAAGVIAPVADGGNPDLMAKLKSPFGLAIYSGSLYIADQGNDRIRRLSIATGVAQAFAGRPPFGGDGSPAGLALLQYPWGVFLKPDGSGLLICDTGNFRIRVVDKNGIISTIAGTGVAGSVGDGGNAVDAQIDFPVGIVADSQGNIYFNELTNEGRIRQIRPDGTIATLTKPGPTLGLALDPTERYLYASSATLPRIYKIDTATGATTIIAGAGASTADGIPAINSSLPSSDGLAVDPDGTLYVADAGTNKIRRIRGGIIDTLVDLNKLLAQEWPGAYASLHHLAFDAKGNLIASALPGVFLHIDVATGVAVKIAGSAPGGFSGDGGPALAAFFGNPQQVAVDKNGRIYVSDYTNHRIRMFVPAAVAVTAQSGDGQSGDANTDLTMPLTVLVTSLPDVPLNDVEVQFVVTNGTATLSADRVRTGLDGMASVTVSLGEASGPVTVTTTAGAMLTATFQLTINEPAAVRRLLELVYDRK